MTIISRKRHQVSRSRHRGRTLINGLGLTVLILACTFVQLFPRLKFFYMMNEVPAWTTVGSYELETYPLDKMKQIARFLLEQPERDRRHLIATYCAYAYAKPHTDDLSLISKLYLLLRLLFDVPEASNVVAIFGAWIGEGGPYPYDGSETVNLLWPLGYQNQRLILKSGFEGYLGAPYDGLAEYDFFASRFPWRAADELR